MTVHRQITSGGTLYELNTDGVNHACWGGPKVVHTTADGVDHAWRGHAKVLSQTDVPIGEDSPDKMVEQLFQGLEANTGDE